MEQDRVISLIIGSEKGLNTNEPASVGGVSLDGVTQQAYNANLSRIREQFPDAPAQVEHLATRPEIVNYFYVLYLGDMHVWILPDFLQYIYADFVVNAGSAAAKIIQRIVGVPADGIIGSGTKRAIADWSDEVVKRLEVDASVDNDLIMEFHTAKLAHYDRLIAANPEKFGKWEKGWKRRANHVLSELSEFFEQEGGTPSAMDEADVLQPTPAVTNTVPQGSLFDQVADLRRRVEVLECRL